MASKLSVIFDAVDNISAKFMAAASAGRSLSDTMSQVENAANSSMNSIESTVDGVADSISEVSTSTDYWTDAIGNYDKSLMEAMYSTEELVDMGYKTEDALNAEAEAADDASESMNELGDNSEDAGEKSSKAISDLDAALAGAGIVAAIKEVADAMEYCADKAEQTETALAQLQTIAGESSMSYLSGDVRELSNEMGVAQTALADVAYNAISAGVAVEESAEAATQASELATAGFTDQASALSVLTTATNSYGDAAGSMEDISDSLITVQNLGVTTVAQLSQQMGKGISTASAYNVSLGNLESAYISVTKAGINTAEGTTYISGMLNELGNSSSDVSKILQEETGQTFGQLMESGMSLADVLEILYENCNQDAEALMNLWGSQEAGKAANAIINQGLEEFNENLNAVENSAGATANAYAVMADTTAFAHQRMDNAAENFASSVGGDLNPMLKELYNIGADIFIGLGNIAEEAPVVVDIAVALFAALATGGTVITVLAAKTKIAAAAEAIWAAATATATTAMVTQAAVIGGAIVALGVFTALMLSQRDAEEELTASSQAQRDELSSLNSEYDQTVAKYGETSDQALKLKSQVDELSESYENSKMTMEQFYTQLDSVVGKHDEIVSSYMDTSSSIREQELATDDLITRLNELRDSSDNSTAAQEQMESIISKLSQMYPSLGLSIDDVNGSLSEMVDKINAVSNAQNAQNKYNSATDTYADLVSEQTKLEEIRDEAYQNYINAGKKYADANAIKGMFAEVTGSGIAESYDEAAEAYQKACDALEENIALQEECTDTMAEYKDMVEGTGDTVVSAQDATSIVIGQTQEEINELAEAYDKAYESALSSVEGQYSLWEKADEVVSTSISDISEAMDSQIEYWEKYSESLSNLADRNIENKDALEAMVASMDNGSTESAAALAGLANASDEELNKIASKYKELQSAQSETASNMADMETSFSSSLDEIESQMEDAVSKMNMGNDASTAARNTIQGYINGIKSMQPGVESAASQVAQSVANALNKTSVSPSVPGHAKGTTNSEKAYIAGEEGPELILSDGGDEVFPTSETDRIISAVSSSGIDDVSTNSEKAYIAGEEESKLILSGNNDEVSPVSENERKVSNTNADTTSNESTNSETTTREKTINININGTGSIGVDKGSNPESVWDMAKDSFKSVFMQILKDEMFEEGAAAYEF